jgi:excisionase family DNA binding protein
MHGSLFKVWNGASYRRERFSASEVARIFGVSVNTVLRWIDQGILSASRPRDGVVMIRRAAIRTAIRRREYIERMTNIAKQRAKGIAAEGGEGERGEEVATASRSARRKPDNGR